MDSINKPAASVDSGQCSSESPSESTDLRCRILLVEDDDDIASLLCVHLRDIGVDVVHADNGSDGLTLALRECWDLLVLDLTLPGLDGLYILKELKQRQPQLPIILVTARTSEAERVSGLDAGADDYITKPFSMLELAARVRAAIRRSKAIAPTEHQAILAVGDIVLDSDSHCAHVNNRRIELTAREFGLLSTFANHPGKVFSRADLLEKVWDSSYEGYRHTVNTHINRLRSKIEPDPAHPVYIRTVWGVGYKLVV